MAKVVFTVELPPHSGEYTIEIPPNFTMREERILRQMADCRSGEWVAELERGSIAAIAATVCIAMRRAGRTIDPRAFEDANPETTFSTVRFVVDKDDDPLAPDSSDGPSGNETSLNGDGPGSTTTTNPETTSRGSTGALPSGSTG